MPGTRTRFRNAISDAAGRVKFDLKDFYNEGEIIVQTDNTQDSGYMVEVQNPFSEKNTQYWQHRALVLSCRNTRCTVKAHYGCKGAK